MHPQAAGALGSAAGTHRPQLALMLECSPMGEKDHLLFGGFSHTAACAHCMLQCTALPHRPPHVVLLNFWTPMDLVLASCVIYLPQFCLNSLCTTTSPSLPDSLDYSVHAHSLLARSTCCQLLPEYLLQTHESLSIFSLHYLLFSTVFHT